MSSHPLRLTLARDNIEGRLGPVKKSLLDLTNHRSQVQKQLRVKHQCLLPCFRLRQGLGWGHACHFTYNATLREEVTIAITQ